MPSLVTERIESVKAGIVSATAFAITELIIILTNSFVFDSMLTPEQGKLVVMLDYPWLRLLAIGAISGFLFGVTYRYIIRDDRNSHLKDGAVLAFGLVRGLALVEGNSTNFGLLSTLLIVIYSLVCFTIARLVLDLAIAYKLIKPFVGDD
ncbi:hypothetical protein IQ255_21250 [Pleurocapsales cyanobacterium LEGE 10410]|nr:hypothetical protein [Pleurocapsales cyanobacterium LEGE 10410]